MSPRLLKTTIYGYAILYQPQDVPHWIAEDSDESPGIPGCYETLAEAVDRRTYLEQRNTPCRIAAILVMPDDFRMQAGDAMGEPKITNRFVAGLEYTKELMPEENEE